MATLNVKDPLVREMAMELARHRGTSATGAIRQALAEALAREGDRRQGLAERVLCVGREASSRTAGYLTDDDLYDGDGLPR